MSYKKMREYTHEEFVELVKSLSEEELFIEESTNRLVIDSSYEDRFNCLLSLFMLKKSWIQNTNNNYVYRVAFYNNSNVEVYSFEEIPDNFDMFMGYVAKLVGDLV